MGGPRGTVEERFWRYVEKTDGCWLWSGLLNAGGYGRLMTPEGVQLAHRISYRMHRGPIRPGAVLDHLCRVPRCVRPDHLEQVTTAVNSLRGKPGAMKGWCRRGHDASQFFLNAKGYTAYCRTCRNTARRERYRRDPAYRAAILAQQRAAHHRKAVPAPGH